MYRDGEDVSKDVEKAIELYQQAIDLGFISVCKDFGEAYEEIGDYKNALRVYKIKGCQNQINRLYKEGKGVDHNDPEVQYQMGLIYSDTWCSNTTKAIKWFMLGEDNNHAGATCKLYSCTPNNQIRLDDYVKAQKEIRRLKAMNILRQVAIIPEVLIDLIGSYR